MEKVAEGREMRGQRDGWMVVEAAVAQVVVVTTSGDSGGGGGSERHFGKVTNLPRSKP